MDISKICTYKLDCSENLPMRKVSYLEFEEEPDNNDIKRMNRDIKIDILEGNKSTSDILEYNTSDMGTVALKIKTIDVNATIFNDRLSAYNHILDMIISTQKTISNTIDIDRTEESLKKLHFAIIKETLLMTKDLRKGISVEKCVIFLNTSNSHIKIDSLGLTRPKEIIYSNRVPVDELIINSVGNIGEIGLNVFESKDNTFYIADIKSEKVIKKIKLKRLQ